MSINVKTTVETPVKYLKAECGVRYWEDASVNGVDDEDGTLIPCKSDDKTWSPTIHLETGRILDWPEGTTASIHYKVCDDGAYHLCDEFMNKVVSINGYVPSMLSPKDNGYGDYVIMDIGPDGKIDGWQVDLTPFEGDAE